MLADGLDLIAAGLGLLEGKLSTELAGTIIGLAGSAVGQSSLPPLDRNLEVNIR